MIVIYDTVVLGGLVSPRKRADTWVRPYGSLLTFSS